MLKNYGKSKKASYILLATIWRVFRMIVVKIICLHFRIDGHHLFRSIPLASRKLHRSQSVDEPVSQILHGNFTKKIAIEVKFCLKLISSNLFNYNIELIMKIIYRQLLLEWNLKVVSVRIKPINFSISNQSDRRIWINFY